MSNKERYIKAKEAAALAAQMPDEEVSTYHIIGRMRGHNPTKNPVIKRRVTRKYKTDASVDKLRRELFESGETRYL